MAPTTGALAASDLQLRRAADGTLLVVGSGWRPDDRLVVSLGPQTFTTDVDHAGDFEVATGLANYYGDLAVHHLERADLPATPPEPQPLALALVQAIAEGAALLGAVIGFAMLLTGLSRWRARA